MAVSLKHTTEAVGTDAGNGEIRKAQWNEEHALTLATARLLGRTTAGAGAVEEISAGAGLSLSAGSLALASSISSRTYVDPVIEGAIAEDVFTISDGAAFEIDPSNGTMQNVTLGASRTPKGTDFAAGESVTLRIKDGTAYTITWTDATFGSGGVIWVGGAAPTLDTTNWTVVVLWKEGSQVYGKYIGVVA
jgi:phosphohistidine swiveling domain-containing protein